MKENKRQMAEEPMKIIATIRTGYKEKFGIPRQSGIADEAIGEIVFLPPYNRAEAVRGIEGFSHLWLLWEFSEAKREGWSPTVRPPRLGGNRRVGVFATRSPFRPNPIGLSSVRLLGVDDRAEGPVLRVAGADLLDGTPIYDIKPYLAYTDAHPEAVGGFSDGVRDHALRVDFPKELAQGVPEDILEVFLTILRHDPRPAYQEDDDRIYYSDYGEYEVAFRVVGEVAVVTDLKMKN